MSNIDLDWQREWQLKAMKTYDLLENLENELARTRRRIENYEINSRDHYGIALANRNMNVEAARQLLSEMTQRVDGHRKAFELLSDDARISRRSGTSHRVNSVWLLPQQVHAAWRGVDMLEQIRKALLDLMDELEDVMKL